MAKEPKKENRKNTNRRNTKKKQEKYNADNEIIIGVTTRPKEEMTRKKKSKPISRKKTNAKTKTNEKSKKGNKIANHSPKQIKKEEILEKEQIIKKSNKKRWMISLAAVLIIIIAGTIYLMTTPMFAIQMINVTGNEKNSEETYISLSKIELGKTNIFAITKSGIVRNLKENPYVQTAVIKRKLPGTLEIEVTERTISYQAEYSDGFIYLNEQGYILEVGKEKKNIMKIEGLSTTKESITEGQRLNVEDLKKLDVVLKIVNYCNYNLIKNTITKIDVTDRANYTLYFSKDGQVAYLGDASNLSERILSLKTILEKEKGNKGEIFVGGDLSKISGYFRPASKKE